MKRLIAIAAALTLLSIGAVAFAHGPGYGGNMMGYGDGPGYGGGYGGGPGFMGRFADTEEGRKFLDETKDLRKKLHDSMFELKEAYLAGDEKKTEKIEKETEEIREQIHEKAEKAGINKTRRGYGRGCYGPYGY